MVNYLINLILYLYFPITLLLIIYYIVVYESKSMNLIKMIMSELPFAQLSEDDNFHEYNGGSDFRYALLYFPLGIYKFYIFTWTTKKQFHFFKAISLKEICQDKIDKKENDLEDLTTKSYAKYITSSNDEKQQHIELIKDLSTQMQEREKVAQFKAMFYITVLAAILSVIFSKYNELYKILEFTLLEQFTIVLIAIYILNAVFILLSFLSVGAYKSETYKDFRDSKEKDKNYYAYWYKQYQRLQKYSDRDVSYIGNIEKYLKLLTFWAIVLGILFLFKGEEQCNKNHSCQDMNSTYKLIK